MATLRATLRDRHPGSALRDRILQLVVRLAPDSTGLLQDARWRDAAVNLALVLGVVLMQVLVLRDLLHRGLHSSNGRFVSVLDSLNTAYGYRQQKPVSRGDATPKRQLKRRQSLYHVSAQMAKGTASGVWRGVLILANNAAVKFGPATLSSLMLGETPVILKGWQHSVSFVLAVLALQLSPGDVAYRCFAQAPVQAVLSQGVSLYKLRKACFVADAVTRLVAAGHLEWNLFALLYATVLMYLVVDGSGQARKLTNLVTAGADGSSTGAPPPVARQRSAAAAAAAQAREWLLWAAKTLRPHAGLVLVLAHRAQLSGGSYWAGLAIRAAAFAFLVWRYEAHRKAPQIPSELLRRLSDNELLKEASAAAVKVSRQLSGSPRSPPAPADAPNTVAGVRSDDDAAAGGAVRRRVGFALDEASDNAKPKAAAAGEGGGGGVSRLDAAAMADAMAEVRRAAARAAADGGGELSSEAVAQIVLRHHQGSAVARE